MGLSLEMKKQLIAERDQLLEKVTAINKLVGSYGAAAEQRPKLPVAHAPAKTTRSHKKKRRGRAVKVAAPPPAAAPTVQGAIAAKVHEMSAERKQAFADRMAKARAAKTGASQAVIGGGDPKAAMTANATANAATPLPGAEEDPLNAPGGEEKEMEAEVGAPGAATGAVR